MTVRFVILDALDAFGVERRGAIEAWLVAALQNVGPPLGASRIDVVVAPERRVIPGWDCNGFAHGPARITIGVDPGCEGREKRPLAEQLRAILAHELHHAMRARGPGYGGTLGEALVSEGLAQCYEEECGCPTPNYATAVQGQALASLAARSEPLLYSVRYDHPTWFFGSRTDPDFPWSGGYSLGYVIVRGWLNTRRLSASAAVDVAAGEVLRERLPILAGAEE